MQNLQTIAIKLQNIFVAFFVSFDLCALFSHIGILFFKLYTNVLEVKKTSFSFFVFKTSKVHSGIKCSKK